MGDREGALPSSTAVFPLSRAPRPRARSSRRCGRCAHRSATCERPGERRWPTSSRRARAPDRAGAPPGEEATARQRPRSAVVGVIMLGVFDRMVAGSSSRWSGSAPRRRGRGLRDVRRLAHPVGRVQTPHRRDRRLAAPKDTHAVALRVDRVVYEQPLLLLSTATPASGSRRTAAAPRSLATAAPLTPGRSVAVRDLRMSPADRCPHRSRRALCSWSEASLVGSAGGACPAVGAAPSSACAARAVMSLPSSSRRSSRRGRCAPGIHVAPCATHEGVRFPGSWQRLRSTHRID